MNQNLSQEIEALKARNQRVELDKAWETSWFRKIIIGLLTYAVIVLFFVAADIQKPFINAIVPAVAYTLSTLSMPYFKEFWLKHFNR